MKIPVSSVEGPTLNVPSSVQCRASSCDPLAAQGLTVEAYWLLLVCVAVAAVALVPGIYCRVVALTTILNITLSAVA